MVCLRALSLYLIKCYIMYIETFSNTISSQHTRRAYQKDLQLFQSKTASPLPSVDRESIRLFLTFLEDRNEASSTIRRRLSALRSFYDWMQESGHCADNPARDVQFESSPPGQTDPPLDVEALQTLISSVTGESKRQVRARALILTVLYGALRRTPLSSLEVENVRPLGRRWVIDLESNRGRGGYVPIPASAVEAIEKVKDRFSIDHGPLWRSLSNRSHGERLSADALYSIVSRSGREANLETPVTIDRLRTSGLRLALSAGAHPDDVRAHSRLQNPRSVANHLDHRPGTGGLHPEVPALIEDELLG